MSASPVRMLDLAEQYRPLRAELLAVLDGALDSGQFVMGPAVREFEAAVAERVGARHAIACASGSDALLLALMALGVGPGDAVVTTPYSFFASVSCITRLGARPLLVDIDPATFNMDAALVGRLLETACEPGPQGLMHRESNTVVRAILAVHLFGQCADMQTLGTLSETYQLPIVEDAAQALGAGWAEGSAGAMGDIGCFSFYPAKNLGCLGDGGILTTSNDTHAEMLRKLRVHGAKPKYVHQFVGINSRLDAIQAGFLHVMLPHLGDWESARRQHAQAYTEALTDHRTIITPHEADAAHHVFNQYVIRSPERDPLRDYLTSKGVSTEIYYPQPLDRQECFAFLGYEAGAFPESDRAAAESLALPVGPSLTSDDQARVIDAILEVTT